MDVADWLRKLGLEQYEPAFSANEIDANLLPSLTSEDLKDLGVSLVGHRRRLLDAIAALGASTGDSSLPNPPPPAGEGRVGPDAERRQLTVMFCDLVGSTALSTRLDPEDLREVLAAYHHAVAELVAGFDGFVARYMGDGVLIYFGHPRAHEDDAERAVRAGLGLIDAVGRLDVRYAKLQARVGIATGLVVVGDVIGEGSAQEQSVVGETPNLAARLQSLAEPGAVVIAAGTRRLVGDLFEYRDLGAIELKGIAAPIPAWQVLRPSAVESRFEALRGSALTQLVGRDEEIDLLLRRWASARAGDGQVVLISGEPGIGKSRLAAALAERLRPEPHIRLRYFCSPYHQDSALFPFVEQLGRASGFAPNDPPAARLEKLKGLLVRAAPTDEDLAFLVDLLSLRTPSCHPLPNFSPQQKKDRTLDALIRQLEGLARQQPVVMLFEDAHWIDPTSRELLDLTVERVRSLPVLLIVTFRPEFQPPGTGQPQVTMLALNRLDRRDQAYLVEQIAGGKSLPDQIVAQIVDRTDGVPLFVDELTKSVLESGLLREGADRYVLDGVSPPRAIPTTLHDSLLARLDRLASVRLVAQIGATIGREFSYELLRAVSRLPEDELRASLARLVASELVFQRGLPPDAVYRFKHALVQDAAHGSLLRGVRQQLHARIAEALEAHSPELMDSQPELFAQHYADGGVVERAVIYWRKAGLQAISRFALAEAIAHLTKAIKMLQELPLTEERREQELGLQIALGDAFIAAKGHGADETGQAFARAYQLGREIGDIPQLFPVLAGMFVHHHVRAEVGREQEAARELLRLAVDRDDVVGQVMGHRALGDSLLNVGHFSSARAHFERAISLFGLDASPVILGEEIGVASLAFLSLCSALLGFPETAVARSKEALERARYRVRHPHTLAFALSVYSRLQWVLRDPRRLEDSSNELFLLAGEHDLRYMRARGTIYRGGALVLSERFAEAVALLEEGMADARVMRAVWLLPFYGGALASAYHRIGRIEKARSALSDALSLTRRTGVEWAKAELERLEADLALSAAVPNERIAETCLHRAMITAQQQGAKLWELRAAVSLARLCRDQGRRDEARDLLAPIYGWFTEGSGTRDLKEAKALLDQLG
jgi:class 3 adenylate cyclase/predicted ATPase